MHKLDVSVIRQQIDQLLLAYPDLADDEVLRADMIEGETDLHEFLRKIERKREDAVALSNALSMTIDELKARKERFERRDQAMRHLMFSAMQWADLRRAELPEATLSVRNGTPKVVIVDEQSIPAEFFRIKREPDKTLIRDALNALENVPGAAMSNAEPVLSVRTK